MGITLFKTINVISQMGDRTSVNLVNVCDDIWDTPFKGDWMYLVVRLLGQTKDAIAQLERFDSVCDLTEEQEIEYFQLLQYRNTLEDDIPQDGIGIRRKHVIQMLHPALKRQWVKTI